MGLPARLGNPIYIDKKIELPNVSYSFAKQIYDRPWKIARSQKMNATQRYGRVKSAKKLLQKFGTKPTRSNSKQKRLINSDFSARINLIQKHNSKNDIVWSKNKTTIPPELLTGSQKRYCSGIMIFGAISSRSLILKHSPIFIDDWLKTECKKVNKEQNTMDRFLYINIKLVGKELKPHIDMIWSIENVWGYIKEKIDECEVKNITELKRRIVQIWNTI